MTRVRILAASVLALGVSALQATVIHAQSAVPEPGRFDLSVGWLWTGGQPVGSNAATETTGTGGAMTLFRTSTELSSVRGLEGRIGVRVWHALDAEAEASYGKPQLRISASNDLENAAPVTAAETIQQLTVGAGIVWSVPYRPWSGRLVPFVTVGGGYLRQVHDSATLIDTGRYYRFGGGAKALLVSRSRRFFKGLGARADLVAIVRSKGVAFDDAGHISPSIVASVFLRF